MKLEDYSSLKETVEFLEVNEWCHQNGLEFSKNLLGLDEAQRELILNMSRQFADIKAKGKCAVEDVNLVDSETKLKEDVREMIFHVRRDKKEIK